MTIIPLILLTIIAASGVFWGLGSKHGYLQLPFLMGASLLLFTIPQAIICNVNDLVPEKAFFVSLLTFCICTLVCYAGFFSSRRIGSPPSSVRLSSIPLIRLGAAVGLAAAFGYLMLSRFQNSGSAGQFIVGGTRWTGWLVYWYTLSKQAVPALAILSVIYIYSRDRKVLIISFITAIPIVILAFVAGRRSMLIWLPVVVTTPWLIICDRQLSKPLIAVGLATVTCIAVLVPAIREYDQTGTKIAWNKLSFETAAEGFQEYFSGKRTLEFPDACLIIGAHYESGKYGLGRSFWNRLINDYVPGGLVGHEFEKSLIVESPKTDDLLREIYPGFQTKSYLAKSGFADSFAEFGFATVILYYFFGILFGKLANQAIDGKNPTAVIAIGIFGLLPAQVVYGSWIMILSLSMPKLVILGYIHFYLTVPSANEQFAHVKNG